MTTIDRAAAYLQKFPTPEAVRAECVRRKVKGHRARCYGCALSELLRKKFGGPWSVLTGMSATKSLVDVAGMPGYFRLSTPVNRFARNFDRGDYPELEV